MTQHQFKQLVLLLGFIAGLVPACGDSSSSPGCSGDGGTDAACTASKADGGLPGSADAGVIDANLRDTGSTVDSAHPIDAPLGNEGGQPMDAHPTVEALRGVDGSSEEAGKPVDAGTTPPIGSQDAGRDSRVDLVSPARG